jgi:hypothetical protein
LRERKPQSKSKRLKRDKGKPMCVGERERERERESKREREKERGAAVTWPVMNILLSPKHMTSIKCARN